MIDDPQTGSPAGAWAKHLATVDARNAANAEILARNDRIKAAMRKPGVNEHAVAAQERVSVHYVRQIAAKWRRSE